MKKEKECLSDDSDHLVFAFKVLVKTKVHPIVEPALPLLSFLNFMVRLTDVSSESYLLKALEILTPGITVGALDILNKLTV